MAYLIKCFACKIICNGFFFQQHFNGKKHNFIILALSKKTKCYLFDKNTKT